MSPKAPGEGPAPWRPTKNACIWGRHGALLLRVCLPPPSPHSLTRGGARGAGGEGVGLVPRERRQAVLIAQQEWGASEERGRETLTPAATKGSGRVWEPENQEAWLWTRFFLRPRWTWAGTLLMGKSCTWEVSPLACEVCAWGGPSP